MCVCLCLCSTLYRLMRNVCFNCFKFRMEQADVRRGGGGQAHCVEMWFGVMHMAVIWMCVWGDSGVSDLIVVNLCRNVVWPTWP